VGQAVEAMEQMLLRRELELLELLTQVAVAVLVLLLLQTSTTLAQAALALSSLNTKYHHRLYLNSGPRPSGLHLLV
jgi:hypothetical protein